MNALEAILGILDSFGKKIASWFPNKETVMRRKIRQYEERIAIIQTQKWTPALGVERDRLDYLLRIERQNLDIYLSANQ